MYYFKLLYLKVKIDLIVNLLIILILVFFLYMRNEEY